MIIYKDLITGDEYFTDAHPIKDLLDVAYEVDAKFVTGQNENFDFGGNPSAEEAAETYDDVGASGINLVLSHRLVEISIDKAFFKEHMKAYTKKILEILVEQKSDRVNTFKTNAQILFKDLLKRFNDLRFFVGESNEMTGGFMMLDFRDDTAPFFIVLKDGLEAIKC